MSDNNHFVNLVKINLRAGRKQQLNFGVLQFVLVVVVFSRDFFEQRKTYKQT